MRRLPLVAIRNKQTIGECELFTKYFDPILASLFSDPDRKVLLRWSNVMSDENDKIRPDATISKLRQRDFGPSLGYGEVKVARPTIDNHALCHDLLLAQLTFPRFLEELATFVSLKNMRTLMTHLLAFVSTCPCRFFVARKTAPHSSLHLFFD
ncbi:hypothetical protein BDB00DRAFT_841917 [Zychaea mexicana]|uniref:uncharacterized protein n=1 Tax=Zychaea mexicana TaxID=64656 RepID=UPI0022FE0551|nr:uncharacterized protein BDB00DRAFT_841917 [Zychaea mexicana]KAI9489664.1 hypothetical protein BDB00DRAFT_841917 [Zychaea mexicana]